MLIDGGHKRACCKGPLGHLLRETHFTWRNILLTLTILPSWNMEIRAGNTTAIYVSNLQMRASLLEVRTKIKEACVPGGFIPVLDSLCLGCMLYKSILLKLQLFRMFVSCS